MRLSDHQSRSGRCGKYTFHFCLNLTQLFSGDYNILGGIIKKLNEKDYF
jgi:hypothetical protein